MNCNDCPETHFGKTFIITNHHFSKSVMLDDFYRLILFLYVQNKKMTKYCKKSF